MPEIEMHLLGSEHLEFLRTVRNDYRVRRWLNTQDEISSDEQRRWFTKYLQNLNWFIFVASDKATAERVGYGQIKSDETGSAELGCVVKPEVWKRGYGSAIVQWLAAYAKRNLHATSVWLQVHADNEAALALYKYCGFEVTEEFGDSIIREGIAIPRLRMVLSG